MLGTILRAIRDAIRDLVQVLEPCRWSIAIVAVGGASFLLLAQGQDVVRRLAEWGTSPWWSLVGLQHWVLFLLAVLLWALSSWYWARVILYLGAPGGSPRQLWLREWAPRLLGTLAIALLGIALWRAAHGYFESTDPLPIPRLRALSVACFALALAFLVFTIVRRPLLRRLLRRGIQGQVPGPSYRVPLWQDLPPSTRWAVAASLSVSGLLGLLFAFWPIQVGQFLGTVPILLITAATWVLFGTGIVFLSRRLEIPVLLLALLAAVVFSAWNDNHATRLVGGGYGEPPRIPLGAYFADWYRGIGDGPILLVAAEGGGIRAAYWTAIVLGELQDRDATFARHVFAISGISGGSLGAGLFDALLAESAERHGPLPCGRLHQCAHQILGNDFLSPPLARLIAPDLAQRFLPFPVPLFDRGRAIEDAWAAAWEQSIGNDRFTQPFLSLWSRADARVPALFLNGTHVETGRRIVTTNLKWQAGDLVDAYDMHQILGADLLLKAALHNSARFTYISPAGTLRASEVAMSPVQGTLPAPQKAADPAERRVRGHVVDGGYFESSGAATALDLRRVIERTIGHDAAARKVYVLYLRNSPQTDPVRPRSSSDPELEPTAKPYPMLNELLSPPRALLNTRDARGSLAVAHLRVAAAQEHFFVIGLCKRIDARDGKETGLLPLPLGWQLSASAQEAMERQLREPNHVIGCSSSNNPSVIGDVVKLLGPVSVAPPAAPASTAPVTSPSRGSLPAGRNPTASGTPRGA
ncbi:MAG TPA: hypothetical protein VHR45_18370 [Thermoanaerobaculia bacterium]|nr:hypothetical protein [Thermoanaerobaculia bacterium]